jgi:hypothetical protein
MEAIMASGSDLDRYMREQNIIFESMDRAATVEAVVDKLTEAMRQMDERDPDALADLARHWTFDFVMRQDGATVDLASDLSTTIAHRIRGVRFSN